MASTYLIEFLRPMSNIELGEDPSFERTIAVIEVNRPRNERWRSYEELLAPSQSGTYKDGDQESRDVPPGGSAYYNDNGVLTFKLIGFKPRGYDRIPPGRVGDGFFVQGGPVVLGNSQFTWRMLAVDGKTEGGEELSEW
jgi:hypothetical protein